MRIANHDGRLVLLTAEGAADVEKASDGRFGPDPQAVYEVWEEFRAWAGSAELTTDTTVNDELLGSPAPRPPQVFGIGLNYADHAEEANLPLPEEPIVFTKFPASISGPYTEVAIPAGDVQVDWEVELVAVIGKRAFRVGRDEDALSYVAGFTAGQDLSERRTQLAGAQPQYSLGKSFPGFSPMGPALVTLDEFADPGDLELGCSVDGESVQHSRSSNLVFSVPELVHRLSQIVPLLPGDVIFTGTTGGVGLGRNPQRFLKKGEVLTTFVDGIGELRQKFV